MASCYLHGSTVYELAEEFGVQRTTVSERLKKAGIKMRLQAPCVDAVDEMVKLYASGLSALAVGKIVSMSPQTVLNHLRARGIRARDSHGRARSL